MGWCCPTEEGYCCLVGGGGCAVQGVVSLGGAVWGEGCCLEGEGWCCPEVAVVRVVLSRGCYPQQEVTS